MAVTPTFDEKKDTLPVFIEPEGSPALFSEPIQNKEQIDIRASNSVWLKSKGIPVFDETLDINRDAYLDEENSSDEGMYQAMSQVVMPSVEPINVSSMLDKWNQTSGKPSDMLRGDMTAGEKWASFLQKKKMYLAEWWSAGTEDGGHKILMDYLDFWPSVYRGTKQMIGLDNFGIPVIDDIAEFTGGLKKDAEIRRKLFLDHLKKEGYLGQAATVKAVDAVGETLVFLNEISRLGLKYGGGSAKEVTRWGTALKTLGHAQKIAVFKALTSEDADWKERLKIWKISSMYMSTTAASGQVGSKAGAVAADFVFNSLISAFKDQGYLDISKDQDMDGFDKVMAAVELFGFDAVLSALTKPYTKAGIDAGIDIDRVAEDMSLQMMNPRQAQIRLSMNPVELARQKVAVSGRGGIEIDKAEAEAKTVIEATKENLEKDIAEAEKAVELKEKAPAAEAPAKGGVGRDGLIEKTQSMEWKGKPVGEERDLALKQRRESSIKLAESLVVGDEIRIGDENFVVVETGKRSVTLIEKSQYESGDYKINEDGEFYEHKDLANNFVPDRDGTIRGEVLSKPTPQEAPTQEAPKTDTKPVEIKSTEAEDKVQLEIAQKKAVLDVIKETEGQPAEERVIAMQRRMEQLGETSEDNAPIKTQINRINRVRKKPVREEITMHQFYKTMESVSREAAKAGVKSIDDAKGVYSRWAEENLTWREAEAFNKKLNKGVGKKLTVDRFVRFAEREAQNIMAPKKTIERTIPIKDISDRADISEAEAFRTVLRASEKAATGARRATIDKITATTKDMAEILKLMPDEIVGKMRASKDNVIKAKTDNARQKRLDEFKEYADTVVKKYQHDQAVEEYKNAVKSARALIKSGKVSPDIQNKIESILDAIQGKQLSAEQKVMLDEARNIEESQLTQEAKDLIEYSNRMSLNDMTSQEVVYIANRINGLVSQMKKIRDEIRKYGKTEAQNKVDEQFNLIKSESPDMFFNDENYGGRGLDKTWLQNVSDKIASIDDLQVIPRILANRLDYNQDGQVSKIQHSLEQAYAKVYEAQKELTGLIEPVEHIFDKLKYDKNGNRRRVEGTNLTLGVADRLRIWLGKQDPDTWDAMTRYGLKKHKGKSSISVRDELFDKIEADMTGEELEAANAVLITWREIAKYINSASTELHGYNIADNPTHSGPRLRIGSRTSSIKETGEIDVKIDPDSGMGFNEVFKNFTLESYGSFKKRTTSKAPVLLYNPLPVLRHQINIASRYYGLAKPLEDANRFILYSKQNKLEEMYHAKGRGATFDAFVEYIRDMNNPYGKIHDTFGRLFERVGSAAMEYTAGRALKVNPKVQLYQPPSFYLAKPFMTANAYKEAEKLFPRMLAAANTRPAEIDRAIDEMSDRIPYLWNRYNGGVFRSIGSFAKTKKAQRGMGGIRRNDAAAIYSIFRGVEADILSRSPDIPKGELDAKIQEKMIDIIMGSQPSPEDVSRPNLSRSENVIARRMLMFMSQRTRIHAMMLKSVSGIGNKIRNGDKITRHDIDEFGKYMLPVVKAQIWITAVQLGFDEAMIEMLGKDRDVYPEEGAEYFTHLAKKYGKLFAINMVGAGGPYAAVASSVALGFELEALPIKSFVRDIKNSVSLLRHYSKASEAADNGLLDEWFEKNRMQIGKDISELATTVALPMTGVNIAHLYKWFVEAPVTAKRLIKPTPEQKIKRTENVIGAKMERLYKQNN